MTKVCFQALPMPQFTTLQKRVFPLYFKLQTGLIVLVAVTHPPMSLVSLINCWWDYVPIGVALGVSALNLVVYGPRTQEVMIERIHQGEIYPNFFLFNGYFWEFDYGNRHNPNYQSLIEIT